MSEPQCPRCDRKLDLVSTTGPSWMAHKAAGPDFWTCLSCKTNWTAEELAEAQEDAEEAGPYADVREVFQLETARGERTGGGRNSSSRSPKSQPLNRRGQAQVDDWNLGSDSEYSSKSRPTNLSQASRVSAWLPIPTAEALNRVIDRAEISLSDFIRLACEKKLEKSS